MKQVSGSPLPEWLMWALGNPELVVCGIVIVVALGVYVVVKWLS